MAHNCPDCDVTCHCCGDIDDCNFGESDECRHFLELSCPGHREYCHDANCLCHQGKDEEDFDECE